MTRPVRDMLLATLFFSLMSLEIKLLPRIPVLEIVFFRAAITLLLCLFILRQKQLSPWGKNRRLLFMRGCFGTLAMVGYFTALTNLPISTASTLQKLSPVFTILIAAFLFAEKVGYLLPLNLIWITCAWAFLPASLIMRGVAMYRIAGLISQKRQRAYAKAEAEPELQIA